MPIKTKNVTVLVAFANGGSREPTGVRISGADGQWAQWGDMSPVERVIFVPKKTRTKRSS